MLKRGIREHRELLRGSAISGRGKTVSSLRIGETRAAQLHARSAPQPRRVGRGIEEDLVDHQVRSRPRDGLLHGNVVGTERVVVQEEERGQEMQSAVARPDRKVIRASARGGAGDATSAS
jgi:hypothetical protein